MFVFSKNKIAAQLFILYWIEIFILLNFMTLIYRLVSEQTKTTLKHHWDFPFVMRKMHDKMRLIIYE